MRSERVTPDELVLRGLDLTPPHPATPPDPESTRKVKAHERKASSRRRRARLELDPACV